MNNNLDHQHNSEDDNSVTDGLYPSVKNAINKIAKQEGYSHYHICTKNISAEGGNCLGVLYEIDIKGETVKGNEQETNLFVKHVVPKSENIKLLSLSEVFKKEIFIYTELKNVFNELQKKANIPVKDRYKFVKIYNGSTIDGIILENLTKQGYKTYGKTDIMKLGYAELCMEQLGKFHSLAFAIEKKMPEYFESKIKTLKQSLAADAAYDEFANKIYKLSTRKLSSDLKLKTDKRWEKALEDYAKYLQGTMTTVKCLCHGDYKTNNIMYREIDGKIADVIAVDYQLTHYGSPVLDFLYFICMGTDQEFRRNHLDHLKDHYHASLKKYLEYFDVLVDDVYPRKIFENEFKDCFDFALVSCLCVLPFSLGDEDGEPDFVDNTVIRLGVKFSDSYYDRLNGILDDFLKWDL